jgi:serine phosphatase RsbU (regulator of sigma subunit)
MTALPLQCEAATMLSAGICPGGREMDTQSALVCARGTGAVLATTGGLRLTTASAQWPPRDHSGDLVEVLDDAPGGGTTIFVGDVAGNGPRAAAIAARSRPEIRRQLRAGRALPHTLACLNDLFEDALDPSLFVTAVVAHIDPDLRTIDVASAGHLGPFLRRRRGGCASLSPTAGPPLGIVRGHRFRRQVTFSLEPGDTVVFATDGVTDRFAARPDFSGATGLLAALGRLPGRPADICRRLLWSGASTDDVDASVLAVQLPHRPTLADL